MPIQTIGNTSALGPRPGPSSADARQARANVAPAARESTAGEDTLTRAIEAVNHMLDPMARSLQFSIDDTTGKTVVKLVDRETNEVLREMPTREMIAIARALDHVQGRLINAKA